MKSMRLSEIIEVAGGAPQPAAGDDPAVSGICTASRPLRCRRNRGDRTMVKHITSVDQSDRKVPINLRQSGPTPVEMLISTRVRKSPYWHLSHQAGCWRATIGRRRRAARATPSS